MKVKQFVRNNSLTLVVFAIFAAAIIGMSLAGWLSQNDDREQHRETPLSYSAYLTSGEFIEGVFENWESEFLQMWALIMLTVFLRQKGSADSKPMRGAARQDTSSRYSIIRAATWRKRAKALRHAVYSHSLGMAMLVFFILAFSLHAAGGVSAYNHENRLHGSEEVPLLGYVASSQFWYESLQNWQSEFLAIGTLLVLSVKLRERGSPESKPVGKKFDHETG